MCVWCGLDFRWAVTILQVSQSSLALSLPPSLLLTALTRVVRLLQHSGARALLGHLAERVVVEWSGQPRLRETGRPVGAGPALSLVVQPGGILVFILFISSSSSSSSLSLALFLTLHPSVFSRKVLCVCVCGCCACTKRTKHVR